MSPSSLWLLHIYKYQELKYRRHNYNKKANNNQDITHGDDRDDDDFDDDLDDDLDDDDEMNKGWHLWTRQPVSGDDAELWA